MNPEIKAKWLEALRSGEYQQGRERLKSPDSNPRYCCLGVLCDLAVKEGVARWDDSVVIDEHVAIDAAGRRAWAELPFGVAVWAGVVDSGGDPDGNPWVDDPAHDGERNTLASLNDSGVSFREIADIIEAQL